MDNPFPREQEFDLDERAKHKNHKRTQHWWMNSPPVWGGHTSYYMYIVLPRPRVQKHLLAVAVAIAAITAVTAATTVATCTTVTARHITAVAVTIKGTALAFACIKDPFTVTTTARHAVTTRVAVARAAAITARAAAVASMRTTHTAIVPHSGAGPVAVAVEGVITSTKNLCPVLA